MKKNNSDITPLFNIVSGKVRPWAQQSPAQAIVATPRFAEFSRINKRLPEGVTVSRNAWTNKGRALRGKRKFGDTETVIAVWEQEGLCTKSEPVLACTIKGTSDFNVGEYTLHCPPGIFILLPPGVPQPNGAHPHLDISRRTTESEDNCCEILWISFWENALRCWICHSFGPHHSSARVGESAFFIDDDIGTIFYTLMREAQRCGKDYASVCGHFIAILFTIIYRLLAEKRFLATYFWGDVSQKKITREDAIEYSQNYIRTHLSESLTLAKVARVCGLSRTQFAHDFTQQTGQTFNRFLTHCRLQHAEHLLESTTWPVNTVSYLVGLSPSQFRDIFRSVHNMTPGEFRRCKIGS